MTTVQMARLGGNTHEAQKNASKMAEKAAELTFALHRTDRNFTLVLTGLKSRVALEVRNGALEASVQQRFDMAMDRCMQRARSSSGRGLLGGLLHSVKSAWGSSDDLAGAEAGFSRYRPHPKCAVVR